MVPLPTVVVTALPPVLSVVNPPVPVTPPIEALVTPALNCNALGASIATVLDCTARELPICRVPALITTPPVKVFVPDSLIVPGLETLKPPDPLIVPLSVTMLFSGLRLPVAPVLREIEFVAVIDLAKSSVLSPEKLTVDEPRLAELVTSMPPGVPTSVRT